MNYKILLQIAFNIIALCIVIFIIFNFLYLKNKSIKYDILISEYKLKEIAKEVYVKKTPKKIYFNYEQDKIIYTECIDKKNVFVLKSDKNIVQVYKGKRIVSNFLFFNKSKDIIAYKICTNKIVSIN